MKLDPDPLECLEDFLWDSVWVVSASEVEVYIKVLGHLKLPAQGQKLFSSPNGL